MFKGNEAIQVTFILKKKKKVVNLASGNENLEILFVDEEIFFEMKNFKEILFKMK